MLKYLPHQYKHCSIVSHFNRNNFRESSKHNEWHQDATSVPYGHLLIDLTPKTVHLDIALIVVLFKQTFIYQQEQRQSL